MRILNDPKLLLTVIGFHCLVAYLVVIAVLLIWWPRIWLGATTMFFGMLAGFIDLHAQDPQLPAPVIAGGQLLRGLLAPSRCWIWPLLLGPWIPLAGLGKASALGTAPSGIWAGLFAFFPAFLGAGLGALVACGRTRLAEGNPIISS